MRPRFSQSLVGLVVLALLFPQQSVFALLNIDGTRNQVFVFGSATLSYDSNVFASSSGEGDYIFSASTGLEVKRRAGIISVNARAMVDYQRFSEFADQSSWNPTFYLELNKTTGRTTGALTVNAFRTSRADSAVNLRTQSWNFPVGLNLKYPVNDKIYLTSNSNYLRRSYTDTSTGLLTYTDYGQAFDVFYVFTSKTDLLGGYRIRVGTTSLGTTTDHSITVGATNGLLPKVNGTVRLGYQWRNVDSTGETYNQITASASVTWNATRKFNVTGSVSRDFMTTAVGGSVDTFSTLLRGNYIFTRRYSVDAGVGYGRNRFLGSAPRTDQFYTWDVGGRIHWNEHFDLSATYSYMNNWSDASISDFERTGYSLNLSTRF